jgi:ribosome maturation factor RimP
VTAESEIIEEVQGILTPILREEGLELVDLEFRPSGKRWLLRVFIDKDGGVTISNCEYVSRELSRILEVEDTIEHAYTLEVSSPGLTRALKRREDFLRSVGKTARLVTSEPLEGRSEFAGEIVLVDGESVEIRGNIGVFRIPICAIKKARLEFEL